MAEGGGPSIPLPESQWKIEGELFNPATFFQERKKKKGGGEEGGRQAREEGVMAYPLIAPLPPSEKEKPLRFVSAHNTLPASAANVAIRRQSREACARRAAQLVGSKQAWNTTARARGTGERPRWGRAALPSFCL